MKMRFLLMLPMLVSVASCTGMQTERLLKEGGNIENVRNRIGLPLQGIMDLPNGNKMWTFSSSASGAMPVGNMWVPMNYQCTVQLETTSSGYIQTWRWQGNNCP
jgi:hypothetical protein